MYRRLNKFLSISVLLLSWNSLFERSANHDRIDRDVRADLGFLASDALRGRGSGTNDELIAAEYIASELDRVGLEPIASDHSFIQKISGTFPIHGTPRPWTTRNVVAILRGRDPALREQIILLTAHMDALGIGAAADNGDSIYNGADDDASGCAAVLEFARQFSHSRIPKRTVMFAFFGSEESGGQGSDYFLAHPPVPIDSIVANLEFEMIGQPDAKIRGDELWLTGYDRSDLGPVLASRGAHIVPDPRPSEDFFRRSDNFSLAKYGVVAHTVSSFGLNKTYHQPSDDLSHIDFAHLEQAIGSLMKPIQWLANSDFRPRWSPGRRPN